MKMVKNIINNSCFHSILNNICFQSNLERTHLNILLHILSHKILETSKQKTEFIKSYTCDHYRQPPLL